MYIYSLHVNIQSGFTPLHAASHNEHSDIVKTLMQNGANINLAMKVRMEIIITRPLIEDCVM